MENKSHSLFIEFNSSNILFYAGKFDAENRFILEEKIIVNDQDFNKGKFLNINEISLNIKKNIRILEEKLNCVFTKVTLILENFKFYCINISGYKKLNGSQVLKENIAFILNSLKLSISENNKDKTIVHIFNSKSLLDGTRMKNIPIGLFGNFYNHELTFFLIEKNFYNNIKQLFKKNNIEIEKILHKSYCDGVNLINKTPSKDTFFIIKIEDNNSHVSFFEEASFRYHQKFNFGTDLIIKDITKICSVKPETVKLFLKSINQEINDLDENEFIEKEYFGNEIFRKIRKKMIIEIAYARIQEIIDIIFNKNTNLKLFNIKEQTKYFLLSNELIRNKFGKTFNKLILNYHQNEIIDYRKYEMDEYISEIANLATFGWKKEAVPISQTKSSIISKIFRSIFG